jgi:hypothetical protein
VFFVDPVDPDRRHQDTWSPTCSPSSGSPADQAPIGPPPTNCEGTIRLDQWTGNDGVQRNGLAVASFKIDKTHYIGRQRPRRERNDGEPRQAEPALNDEIPF